jgi:hypothetical protein
MPTHTTELPEPDLAPYTKAQVAFAIDAWPMRAAEELRSAWIFRALARAARAARIPEPWPARFAEAMRDEVRHARLCATVGARLGAAPPRHDAKPVDARLAPLSDPRLRVGALLVVEVAIGETISTLLFGAGRRSAVEPLTRAALASIVADEARHQRLGWTGATALWPLFTAAERAALQREAAAGLAAFEQDNAVPALRRLERGDVFDPSSAALGVLAPETRVEAFYFAVEKLVVPRLHELGLDGTIAWSQRYRAPRLH